MLQIIDLQATLWLYDFQKNAVQKKKSAKTIYTEGTHPHLIIYPPQNTGAMFGVSCL